MKKKYRYKEYSIITPEDEQHFEKKSESDLYWKHLPEDIKKESQYFSKVWENYGDGDEFTEGEVILLN